MVCQRAPSCLRSHTDCGCGVRNERSYRFRRAGQHTPTLQGSKRQPLLCRQSVISRPPRDFRKPQIIGAVCPAVLVLLEPVMQVECTVTDEHHGDILGDLNRRRARITGIDHCGTESGILAQVPLAEMFGYAGAIRSLSRGRA